MGHHCTQHGQFHGIKTGSNIILKLLPKSSNPTIRPSQSGDLSGQKALSGSISEQESLSVKSLDRRPSHSSRFSGQKALAVSKLPGHEALLVIWPLWIEGLLSQEASMDRRLSRQEAL